MKGNCDKGFTLVELLIVIMIIGILLTITVISFSNIRNRANTDVCLSNQRTIKTARVYNYVNNNAFGNTEEEIVEALKKIGFKDDSLKDELACPSGGTYKYELDSPNISCSIVGHN